MKILSSEQIKAVDSFTIENEPITSNDLMERTANACFKWIIERFDKTHNFDIYVGLGNNGGDVLVIARLLYNIGYTISVKIIRFSEKTSEDFNINYNRLHSTCKDCIIEISENTLIESNTSKNTIIIDAILGSGLSKPVDGFIGSVINDLNKTENTKISIDIPSGLFSEYNEENKGVIFNANYTLTFHVAKLALLFVIWVMLPK